MELPKAAEALRALAANTENRSKIGRLRGIYAEVEATQRAGVSNSKIVETLNAQGFDLTLKTFETMLYRIRKERAEAAPTTTTTPSAELPSAVPSPVAPPADVPRPVSRTADTVRARRPVINIEDFTDSDDKDSK